MAEDRETLTTGVVWRLPARKFDATEFDSDGLKAHSGDFKVSSTELARLEEGDGIGAISVWDSAHTTHAEACAILTQKPRLILKLEVPRITDLRLDLMVFRTPKPEPPPGNRGHCDLEDVWQGTEKRSKRIRDMLAAIAETVDRYVP
jgi:hypothetical protein